MTELPTLPSDYATVLSDLKTKIRSAQVRAALAVNRELLGLYWQIGQAILSRQAEQGWGAQVIGRLSQDLRTEFPELKGFSPTNLKYMRMFASAYPNFEFGQQPVDQLPWGHLVTLLTSVKDPAQRGWYAQATVQQGWSRNILVHQIESRLYDRQGQASHNFTATLPDAQSELAGQLLKDPYNFDFLSLGRGAHERDLERGLLTHLRDFMLELAWVLPLWAAKCIWRSVGKISISTCCSTT